MKRYHAISLAAVIAQASAVSSSSFHSDLNGWYACSDYTSAASGGSNNRKAEYAVYSAPLCYPGICEAPEHVDSTVDIFVKRIPAESDPETASNVWMLEGGPGFGSAACKAHFDLVNIVPASTNFRVVEVSMVEIHALLNGSVNVYLMDHRGTGRSTLLDCVATQITSTRSPTGTETTALEVPACAKAVFSEESDDSGFSIILYYLIIYSETWEKPTPSIAEMTLRFTNARISNNGKGNLDVPRYCAFSKEKSAVCDQLGVGNYDGNGIIYKVDKYWNKSATIPPQASVLLLSSKLDPQTPHKYAESLLEVLIGEKKELITFSYATHGDIVSTPLGQGNETCGMKLLVSYVTNDGDLKLLDKSCVDEMPAFNMTPPLDHQYYFLSTDDLYDGVYNKSLSGGTST